MTGTGSKIVYRRASLEDVPTLVDYRIRFLNELDGRLSDDKTKVVSQSLLRYFTKAIPSSDFVGWVAERDGRIIATAGMVVWEKPALYEVESGRLGYLLNFYTIPGERGRGIAARLLNELIKEAKSLGLKHLHLHASKQGEPIYRKAGFKEPRMPELTLRLE
jgi:GNAT superfamily N-acetyltransferase